MSDTDRRLNTGGVLAGRLLGRFGGLALAGLFYAFVALVPIASLERYFLGHPIAVATTVLFCLAAAQLGSRFLQVLRARAQFTWTSDRDLLPEHLHALADLDPHDGSHQDSLGAAPQKPMAAESANQTGLIPSGAPLSMDRTTPTGDRVACWLHHLSSLPTAVTETLLGRRLFEVLARERRRGNTGQLSEDLRDLADRDADADHDALQLVRIITWAIPMLGFLGTVVGITQTLGGLDFTDGAAAVDRLKSGLYVAFDTTALGLVLSVIAIFLQFPVEKASRQLLEQIDARLGRLVPAALAEATQLDREDPLAALHQMTVEISRNVQASIHMQADIWRETIDSAHSHWQQSASEASNQLREALESSLGDSLATTLRAHADGLRRVQREGADAIDNRWQQWQTALSDNARILLAHQKTLLSQGELLAQSNSRARELERLQTSLDNNVRGLDESLETIDRSLQAVTGAASMADAMMTLARAVDVLATRMNLVEPSTATEGRTKPRRNAA